MDIILVLKLKRKTADENLYNSIKQSTNVSIPLGLY